MIENKSWRRWAKCTNDFTTQINGWKIKTDELFIPWTVERLQTNSFRLDLDGCAICKLATQETSLYLLNFVFFM